jgi:RNA polymerase sigma-70 factor (ECF subfamily)
MDHTLIKASHMKAPATIIWTETQSALKAFIHRRVRDKAVADDILQDVFLKMYTRMDQLHDAEKITAWIYQITRNTITDYFRSQNKSVTLPDLDWESDHANLNDCVHSCLKEMLLTLPAKYRQAIELTELENLSQMQLAERLNISYSGAKSRVQRARQMLKRKMDEQYTIKLDAYGNVTVCENRGPCHC